MHPSAQRLLISDRWFGFHFCECKHWRATRQHLGDEQQEQMGSGGGGPRARWSNPSGNGINWAPPYAYGASARPGNDDDEDASMQRRAAAASSGFPLRQLGAACRPSR